FALALCTPPVARLFPYTTLFRSVPGTGRERRPCPPHRTASPKGRVRGDGRLHAARGVGRAGRAGRPGGRHDGHGTLAGGRRVHADRKSTRLNSSHVKISYAVFCL